MLTCLCLFGLILSCNACGHSLPPDFIFGVATSSYQIEGAWQSDNKAESIWDRFSHTPGKILDNSTGDIACDHYHKYKEDIKLLDHLGVDFYRFSLSWPRILPEGTINKVNEAGIEFYDKLLNELNERGIEAVVTLYHWDLPQSLQDLGGWTNGLIVDYFEDYVKLCLERFGNKVKKWISINEPYQICHLGYGLGVFAPGYKTALGTYLCSYNVMKAHSRAYHLFDKHFRSNGSEMGITIESKWYEPDTDLEEDQEAARRALMFHFGWFAHPVVFGDWPQVMKDRIKANSLEEGYKHSRLPKFSQHEREKLKGSFDFIGFNHYTTSMAKHKPDKTGLEPSWDNDLNVELYYKDEWPKAASPWLREVPWGFKKVLKWIDSEYNHPRIFITENGFSDHGGLKDKDRIGYFKGYLKSVQEAIKDNVTVIGYTAWSLMDNFEWDAGYTQRFGLVAVDFDDPERKRTMKDSAKFYKKVISSRCLNQD